MRGEAESVSAPLTPMFSDLRYVLRSLGRARGFAAVTILTLGLGLGAAAAIFSVVDRVLFRIHEFPDELVWVGGKTKEGTRRAAWGGEVVAYRELQDVFSGVALARPQQSNVVIDGEPVAAMALAVSSEMLSVIGVRPALGRGFLAEDARDGRAVVVSDAFWREHLKGAEDALGREVVVGETVCTVVGVLRSRQVMPPFLNAQVYQAVEFGPEATPGQIFWTFARLREGVSREQAEQAIGAAKVELPPRPRHFREASKPALVTMPELQQIMRPEVYWVLVGAVGFLFGIACLNAANLMLVRMLGRKRELSVRLALGGGHARLVRLLAMESVMLSLGASAVGVLVANWMVPLLLALSDSGSDFRWDRWTLDGRALAALMALAVLTSLLVTVAPGLRLWRTNVLEGLKDGACALGEGRGLARLRGGLVALQTAFAVVLLTGAGLMVRTMARLESVPLGFDEEKLMKVRLSLPPGYAEGNEERLALLRRLQEHFTRLPGVSAAAYGTDNLLPGYYDSEIAVELGDGTQVQLRVDYVSENFLETSGLMLKRGRMLPERGAEVMINESFARVRFGEADPVGQVLKPIHGNGGLWTVVGVVSDMRETLREAPGFHVYAPETWYPPNMDTFVVRVRGTADATMAAALKRAVYAFDPKIVPVIAAPLAETRGWQTYYESFVLSVLRVLSGIALVLTVVGVFSVLVYTVDRRMGEFGVRMALGATGRDLVGLVMRRGVMLVLVGVVVGVSGALGLTRYLQSLLFETAPYDPVVLSGVSGILLLAAVMACAWPARRAAKVDVAGLLRRE